MENPYMAATSPDELHTMEKALYDESHVNGQLLEGSAEYYETQMEMLENAWATLFPDEYDYHKRGRQQQGKD